MRIEGKKVWEAIKDQQVTVLAANTRSELSIEPILSAVEEMESVVALELAKSESFEPGYTGISPQELSQLAHKYAQKVGNPCYFLHEDHNTFGKEGGTSDEKDKSKQFRDLGLESDFSSFSVDASYLPLEENIRASIELARPIVEAGKALEVEVGEIKKGGITEMGEAVYFIQRLEEEGINPELLAINNGSVHGHYQKGEWPHLHLRRTYDIAKVIRMYGVKGIAQHGTSGTALEILYQFPEHEIKKANVATHFQDIVMNNLPSNLKKEIEEWMTKKGKSIKYANKEFREKIMNIKNEFQEKIFNQTFQTTKDLIRAFKSEGLRKKIEK